MSKALRDFYRSKAKARVEEFQSFLNPAFVFYKQKRMSWFKAPKWSCGLNYNWFDGTCMLSDGQDCMYSDQPEVCIKPAYVWPTDECHPKPDRGAKGACDVISYYCKMGGRINPWQNYIMGTKMYYWTKENQMKKAKKCYENHKAGALRGLNKFEDKLRGLRDVASAMRR